MLNIMIEKVKNKLQPYISYFIYVIEHKKNIYNVCKKKGMRGHGILHDFSKLSYKEFFPYARYFYVDKETYRLEFEKAWYHHYKSNPHHWEHWLDANGEPTNIPIKYIAQMLADWEAMSIKFGDSPQAYYLQNYYKFKFTTSTRMWVEYMLGINTSLEHSYGATLEEAWFMKLNIHESNTEFKVTKEMAQRCRDNEAKWFIEKFGVDIYGIFEKHHLKENY